MKKKKNGIHYYIYIFLLGSFLGWIIECIYRSLLNHHIINPGFLSGPFLPIYGFGLVLLTALLNNKKIHWILQILLFAFIATFMEFISGWFFQSFYHIRLWDYSNEWGNIYGWICPLFFFYWLISGFLYFTLLHNTITTRATKVTLSRKKLVIMYILIGIIFVDMTHAFYYAGKISESWTTKYKKNFPMLSDYKIFKSDDNNFFNSIIESLKNYSNHKLPEKIFKK